MWSAGITRCANVWLVLFARRSLSQNLCSCIMLVCASFSIATTWNGLPCSCEPLPEIKQVRQEMGIPPDFAADIHRAQQLEEQRQRDPQAILPLIQVYKRMLERLRPNDDPTLYAALQYNLGNVYGELPTGDRAANLAQAIGRYQEALRFYTPEADPLHYAMTQTNLGEAYRNLPTGDRAANLAQAINYYQEALRFYRPEADPLHYATTLNNLGAAYGALPTGD